MALSPFISESPTRRKVLNFENLARHLGENQPVSRFKPQGLDGQASFSHCVEDMASFYLSEIRKRLPRGVFHLAGYSFGDSSHLKWHISFVLRVKQSE